MFMVYHGNLWESMENFSFLLTVHDLFLSNLALRLQTLRTKKIKKMLIYLKLFTGAFIFKKIFKQFLRFFGQNPLINLRLKKAGFAFKKTNTV